MTGGSVCTLRDAITAANTNNSVPNSSCAAGGDNDTIEFDEALNGETITLLSALPEVTSIITISGSGQDETVISGAHSSRILVVDGGNLTLASLTLMNGYTSSNGGAIYSRSATLSLDSVTLSGNSANYGAAQRRSVIVRSQATLRLMVVVFILRTTQRRSLIARSRVTLRDLVVVYFLIEVQRRSLIVRSQVTLWLAVVAVVFCLATV